MSDQPILMPCPFCGGSAFLDHRKEREWAIGCGNRECPFDIVSWFKSEAEALDAWNRRHLLPRPGKTLADPTAYDPKFGDDRTCACGHPY